MNKKYIKTKFIVTIIGALVLALLCMRVGSIDLSLKEIVVGLIHGGSSEIEIIKAVRLPRIFIALFTGGMLSVAGVLLQAVMRNPLADPGIIGISAGATCMNTLMLAIAPGLVVSSPIAGLLGGVLACALVYAFAWENGFKPQRIILAGIAINALFGALGEMISYMTSSSIGGSLISQAQSLGKGWDSVRFIVLYGTIGLILSFILYKKCNTLALGERNARSLGMQVNKDRIFICLVAVLLAIIPTVEVGVISFVGLVVPHLSRIIIGHNHKQLIPFSALLGGTLLLGADLLGRVLIYPFEIPISIMMSLIGAPFFLYMLRRRAS